jgi:CheY-like chemotaxis protein/two-component sensor histidine kinase
MIRIVDDLLDVSRVTHGKISLHRTLLNVADLMTQALEASRPLMDARGLTLHVAPMAEPLLVFGDAARLGQVLENLLGNAIKYTPAGGTVTIAATQRGDDAVLTVRDTGIGIAAAMLPRVFDLFAQADTSLDRAEGGLGIGLTLVDRLTRMHGGRAEVESDGPGHGSTFTITLPLAKEGLSPAALGAAGDAVQRPAQARRILIVDDNVDSAETLAALLTLNGHTTHAVFDGTATLGAVHSFAPDVVLLDVGLPGMNGFQVVQQLRATAGLDHLRIVATTGYGRWEDRVKCLAAGFSEHLAKPVDVDDIERVLAAPPPAAGAAVPAGRRD